MHFALPPRKTSFPPPYARVSALNTSSQRRKQIQYLGYLLFAILTFYLFFSFFSADSVAAQDGRINEEASVVITTVFDESSMSDEYISTIKKNRDEYAARHGYKTFYTNVSTYTHLTEVAPRSWSLVPALRDTLTRYPETDYVWSLTPHALISNLSLSLHSHVFSRLPDLMRKDIPVVPPDSVIHTFSHLKPSNVYLILTQDQDNVAPTSFILRNTETVPVASGQPKDTWSQYFLDAWFDPLYRSYAFQKAENHALEHLIQWHPTLLAKLVIVEQRVLNSYSPKSLGGAETNQPNTKVTSMWQAGDLVINFKDCAGSKERNCMLEMKQHLGIQQETIAKTNENAASG